MKKIRITILSIFAFNLVCLSQLTLTKIAHEPVAGDIKTIQACDSAGVLINSVGANQNWNFSSLVQTMAIYASTFVLPSGVPASSLFPGTTLVEKQVGDNYIFWKSTNTPTTQFEYLGHVNTFIPVYGFYFNNSEVDVIWPMSPGATITDTFSINFVGSNGIGSGAGSQTVVFSGSGNMNLPGGKNYSNVSQIKTTYKSTLSMTFSTVTTTYTDSFIQYQYYHASQKFPLLEIMYYYSNDGSGIVSEVSIFMNQNISLSYKDQDLDINYKFYPNPTKNNINIELSNPLNEICTVEITDTQGRKVTTINLGHSATINEQVSITELKSGIYFIKTKLGQKHSVRKLIVE